MEIDVVNKFTPLHTIAQYYGSIWYHIYWINNFIDNRLKLGKRFVFSLWLSKTLIQNFKISLTSCKERKFFYISPKTPLFWNSVTSEANKGHILFQLDFFCLKFFLTKTIHELWFYKDVKYLYNEVWPQRSLLCYGEISWFFKLSDIIK